MFKMRSKISALVLGLALSGAIGCTAPEDEKLGFAGEFCGSDVQCQDGLVCRNNLCQSANPQAASACEAICTRFVDSCGRVEASCASGDSVSCCRSSCTKTIELWRQEVITQFKDCAVTDLTCDEAKGADAINICYDRLPALPEDRQAICQRLRARASSIGNSDETAADLAEECRILGRTATLENWNKATVCDDASLTDSEFAACANTVFPFLKEQVIVAP